MEELHDTSGAAAASNLDVQSSGGEPALTKFIASSTLFRENNEAMFGGRVFSSNRGAALSNGRLPKTLSPPSTMRERMVAQAPPDSPATVVHAIVQSIELERVEEVDPVGERAPPAAGDDGRDAQGARLPSGVFGSEVLVDKHIAAVRRVLQHTVRGVCRSRGYPGRLKFVITMCDMEGEPARNTSSVGEREGAARTVLFVATRPHIQPGALVLRKVTHHAHAAIGAKQHGGAWIASRGEAPVLNAGGELIDWRGPHEELAIDRPDRYHLIRGVFNDRDVGGPVASNAQHRRGIIAAEPRDGHERGRRNYTRTHPIKYRNC
eukprot:CAMPEP_0174838136 /NCGR_PEP_ID=MMETSP1114-20130205/7210_1 /TAXON_ID=312471 /ORGANISM="Neobodo designis, Strain CCAP 1951/1" /LENGTH=320 /DNA_ID=CAMNT_0016072229 /DNA_START=450 /DNA_END=1408 /DNA_ORIENTATION=+